MSNAVEMSMTPEQGFFQQEETQDAGEERCKQGMLVGMAFECLGQQVKQGGTKQRTHRKAYQAMGQRREHGQGQQRRGEHAEDATRHGGEQDISQG